mmetsp:Transcript_95425/g.253564  ORF Transcript_95425/g.253564 Transcript_95425/m.253564 type:complete len:232 (+) Transcript_95425:295-990(+)
MISRSAAPGIGPSTGSATSRKCERVMRLPAKWPLRATELASLASKDASGTFASTVTLASPSSSSFLSPSRPRTCSTSCMPSVMKCVADLIIDEMPVATGACTSSLSSAFSASSLSRSSITCASNSSLAPSSTSSEAAVFPCSSILASCACPPTEAALPRLPCWDSFMRFCARLSDPFRLSADTRMRRSCQTRDSICAGFSAKSPPGLHASSSFAACRNASTAGSRALIGTS